MAAPERGTQPKAAPVASYFDACAATWRRHYAPDGAMQARVGRFAQSLGMRVAAGARVLDFGCGTGDIARALAEQGYVLTGCDLAPAMIEVARSLPARGRVEYLALEGGRSPQLPFADACFDAVVASSVFEYLDDPAAQALELRRVLRRDGWLLLTVPDPRDPVRSEEAAASAHYAAAWWRPLFERLPIGLRRRTRLEYLKLSRNRYPLARWRELLAGAGFEPAPETACEGPLALLSARAAG